VRAASRKRLEMNQAERRGTCQMARTRGPVDRGMDASMRRRSFRQGMLVTLSNSGTSLPSDWNDAVQLVRCRQSVKGVIDYCGFTCNNREAGRFCQTSERPPVTRDDAAGEQFHVLIIEKLLALADQRRDLLHCWRMHLHPYWQHTSQRCDHAIILFQCLRLVD